MLAGASSKGIYIYNSDNVVMAARSSSITIASKLFQIPDGLAFMAYDGTVQYTTNCDNAQKFDIQGITFTN
jgi:hypothetical protein